MNRDTTRQESLEDLAAAVRSVQSEIDDLLKATRPLVCRWALIHTGDSDLAEDVAQIALVRVHQGFGGFRGGRRFSTWLYRVVANVARDEERRVHRHDRDRNVMKVLLPGRNSLAAADADQIGALLKRFLEDLSPRQRAAFELVDLQGYSGADAAAMEGVEESTLRVHLSRARAAVRAAIEENTS